MRSFIGTAQLLLVLLLQLIPAQVLVVTQSNSSRVENSSQMLNLPRDGQITVGFLEVLTKSLCQPMEQLVEMEQEFPWEVEHIYRPSSVLLRRCSGCCGDEQKECRPTTKRNITLQVLRVYPTVSEVDLTFVEHQACKCRVKQKPQNDRSITSRPRQRKRKKTASHCSKC